MKRFLLLILGLFLANTLVFAQLGVSSQRGRATQELTDSGLCAAHSSIPLYSKAKIINIATEAEIEVTITGRVLASPRRVIDLSADAWKALDLTPDTIVMVVYTPPAPPQVRQQQPRQPVIETEPEVVEFTPPIEEEPDAAYPVPPLYHLLVLDRTYCDKDSDIGDARGVDMLYKFKHGRDGYLVALYTSAENGPVFPVMPERSRILVDLVTVRTDTLSEYVHSSPFRKFVTHRRSLAEIKELLSGLLAKAPSRPVAEVSVAKDVPAVIDSPVSASTVSGGRIKVVPAMPKANSGKIYCLQVGAFTMQEIADEAAEQLTAAGFAVIREMHGSWYRVVAVGIRATDVAAAVDKLEAAGFKEVWIRE